MVQPVLNRSLREGGEEDSRPIGRVDGEDGVIAVKVPAECHDEARDERDHESLDVMIVRRQVCYPPVLPEPYSDGDLEWIGPLQRVPEAHAIVNVFEKLPVVLAVPF